MHVDFCILFGIPTTHSFYMLLFLMGQLNEDKKSSILLKMQFKDGDI